MISKRSAASDENYLYVAFEVADEGHIDCTAMIRGGDNCVFAVMDMPSFFRVANTDNVVYAEPGGTGAYDGIAAYRYEDGLLTLRLPLEIYDGATGFTINATTKTNAGDEKTNADMVEDFQYTVD